MTYYFIDRRLNPKDKSLGISERFKRRAKDAIKAFVDDSVNNSNSIETLGGSEKITIKSSRIHQPTLHLDHKEGIFTNVLPGNKHNEQDMLAWVEKDRIEKPKGGGGGKGNNGSPDGAGEDDFIYSMPEDEKYEILFEDLELPNQRDTNVKDAVAFNRTRAGFTNSGSPSNFSVKKTMRNSIGRRLSLNRPDQDEIDALEADIKDLEDCPLRSSLLVQLQDLKERRINIPYIDTMDVKYFNIVKQPKPVFQAVMFCLMDVSGSMSQQMKDLAKRFYILLYRFLKQKYRTVEVVFVKHHHQAETVTEENFFYSRETGGTVVSTGLIEMKKHIEEKYNPDDYNIYVAQTTDGDNTKGDNPLTHKLLQEDIIPKTQYYAYLEVGRISDYADEYGGFSSGRESDLWGIYSELHKEFPTKFVMKKAAKRTDIFPVFHELFQKR